MNDVDKVIAPTIALTHLSFSLGTFQIRLQVADLLNHLARLSCEHGHFLG